MSSASKTEARASLLYNQSYSLDRPSSPYQPYPDGGYHQREGFVTASSAAGQQSRRPAWLFIPSSKWSWSFMIIAVVQAIVCLAFEGHVFVRFQTEIDRYFQINTHNTLTEQQSAARRTIPTYLSLFIFGFVYELVLVYDALRLQNTIQIIGLVLYNIGMLIEAAVQIDQIRDAIKNMSPIIDTNYTPDTRAYFVTVPCLLGLGTVLLAGVAWKLYGEFSWTIYKHISADLRLKRRFLSYQIYIALLKFDFFFFLAFTVQFVVIVRIHTSEVEFYLTIAAIPVTIILLILAAYWTRTENYYGMFTILILWFGGLAYFLFKLFRMYFGPYSRVRDYIPARNGLTVFAVMTVVLIVITIIYCCICTANFKKGLKPHLSADRQRRRAASTDLGRMYSNGTQLGGAGPSRMTID